MNLEVLAHFILSGVATLQEVTLSIKELRHNDDRSVVVTRSDGIVDDDEGVSASERTKLFGELLADWGRQASAD